MSYSETVKRLNEQNAPQVRIDWSCKANGCPNTGSMDGRLCYFHWREPEPTKWDAVTQRIRENFDAMRNWGQVSPELAAKRRADAQRRQS